MAGRLRPRILLVRRLGTDGKYVASLDDLAADFQRRAQDHAAVSAGEFNYEDEIFRVPRHLAEAEPRYAAMHEEMVRRLRQEAYGLNMSTVQNLLIARIASEYVLMTYNDDLDRWRYLGTNAEKDARANWRSLVVEFNRMLTAGEDKRRDALMAAMQEILVDGLALIEDRDVRAELRTFYLDKFTTIGES